MTRLAQSDIQSALAELPGWSVEEQTLRGAYRFDTFEHAMAFANEVADLAIDANHHPEICIDYNRLRLSLTTHDEGGITEKDVELARRIARLSASG